MNLTVLWTIHMLILIMMKIFKRGRVYINSISSNSTMKTQIFPTTYVSKSLSHSNVQTLSVSKSFPKFKSFVKFVFDPKPKLVVKPVAKLVAKPDSTPVAKPDSTPVAKRCVIHLYKE